MALLASFLILTTGSCSIVRVQPVVPCPDVPELLPLPTDLQIRIPPDAVWIMAQNQLALKAHIKELRARACDDG
jgi:hypothetical protein